MPAKRRSLKDACERVGRFLYHFSRIEQKLDQVIIKVFNLEDHAAPIITGSLDFAKKLNLVRTFALNQSPADERRQADEFFRAIFAVNNERQTVAHSSFEPTINGGVKFSRIVARDGRVSVIAPIWDRGKFERLDGEMSALANSLDDVVEAITPTPISDWTEADLGWMVPPPQRTEAEESKQNERSRRRNRRQSGS